MNYHWAVHAGVAKIPWLRSGSSTPSVPTTLSCSNWLDPVSSLLLTASIKKSSWTKVIHKASGNASVCFVSWAELWGNVLISAHESKCTQASVLSEHSVSFCKVCSVADQGPICPALFCFPKFASWNKADSCNYAPQEASATQPSSGFPEEGPLTATPLGRNLSAAPKWGACTAVAQHFRQDFLASFIQDSISLIASHYYYFSIKQLSPPHLKKITL